MKKFIFIIFLISLSLLPLFGVNKFLYAQTGGIIEFRNPLRAESFDEILDIVANILRVLAIGVGTIMIIWGGIMIMTSAGSEERVTKGKNILKWTLIGVAIAVSASFIIDLIKELLG